MKKIELKTESIWLLFCLANILAGSVGAVNVAEEPEQAMAFGIVGALMSAAFYLALLVLKNLFGVDESGDS